MRSDADLLSSRTPEDFSAFYERHVRALTAYAGRRSQRADITYDVVAETFARALQHRHAHDPRRGPAISWLFGIANHLLLDAERRGAVADSGRARLGMDPVVLDVEQLGRITARSRADLIQALSALPESQRIAVIPRVLGEQDHEPLSGRVECSSHVQREP